MVERELTYTTCYMTLNADLCERELQKWFYSNTRKTLSLDAPRSFNEKIQWLKLYDSTPEKTVLADKYLVREWVKEKVGEKYLIKSLGSWDSFDDINFDKLPSKFVLKANHGCGWNLIVSDKSTFNAAEAKEIVDKWVASDYGYRNGFELHYLNISPRIVAEEYIDECVGYSHDYRFFCFDGKPEFIFFEDVDENKEEYYRHYDLDWNLLDFKSAFPGDTGARERPDNLDEMIEVARKLCAGFPFVRIDLYSVNGKVYFGEATFTPQNGKVVWRDDKNNELYGDMICLPEKSLLPQRVMGKMMLSEMEAAAASVVILAHNVSSHIGTCVESILKQTCDNIEVVCVNDGSTDSTLDVIESYAKNDPRVSVINLKTHMGLNTACLVGVEHAKGRYILFVDGHDHLVGNALEQLTSVATENQLDVLTYGCEMLEPGLERQIELAGSSRINQLMSGADLLAWQLNEKEYLSSPTLRLIRRECLTRNYFNFASDSIFEDELFTPMLLSDARRAMCIPDKLYVRHSVRQSSTPTISFQNNLTAYSQLYGKYMAGGFIDVGLMLSAQDAYNRCMSIYSSLTADARKLVKQNLRGDHRTLFINSSFELVDIKEKKSAQEKEWAVTKNKLGTRRDELSSLLAKKEDELKAATEKLAKKEDELKAAAEKAEAQRSKQAGLLKEKERELKHALAAQKKAENQRDNLLQSYSYRIGKKLTAFPRAMRKVIRAIKKSDKL